MNIVRITVTGSDKPISDFEAFLRKEDVQIEKGTVAANDASAAMLAALIIIAKFDVIPKCIAAFRSSRKPTIKFTRFVEGKGFEEFESYDPDAVSKVLEQTTDVHIEDESITAPIDEYNDPTPIATVEQFKAALLVVRDRVGISPKELALLRAHCRAPNHTISTFQLAKELGYSGHGDVNKSYGKFAHEVADALHHIPPPVPDGEAHWWRTLAYGKENDHYEWIMRPELVQALQEMKWA